VRSTNEPGVIKVTATRKGLEPGTVEIQSQTVHAGDGM
jgi:hypothetical protein